MKEDMGTSCDNVDRFKFNRSNVFQSHVCTLKNDDLPSLCIYTQDEEIEVGASGDPRVYHSTMILIADGYA